MADDQNPKGPEGNGDGFKPITTPAELDAFLKDRVSRAERKAIEKFADYDDLKAKAAELDKIRQASQTEAEKTAEQIAKLTAELGETKATAMRSRVQAKFGITDEDAELFLTATDEATLTKQAERLAAHEADRKKTGNRAPLQGRTPNPGAKDDPTREFVRGLFGRPD